MSNSIQKKATVRPESIQCLGPSGRWDWEMLTSPLLCEGLEIPVEFKWNGSGSVAMTEGNWFSRLANRVINFSVPRYGAGKRASCYHDYAVSIAKNKKERAMADQKYVKILKEDGLESYRCKIARAGVWIGTQKQYGLRNG